MPNYRSLIPGGFFQDPETSHRHVSIRANNPGAINGAMWERSWPGYVKDIKYDGKNNTTIFETPEYGVAVWYELMRKYHNSNPPARTIKEIVWKYGGGQANYTSYGHTVAQRMGRPEDTEIVLESDASLLPFAKAMFQYEAGEAPPWSDQQILYGFNIARAINATGKVPPYATNVAVGTAGVGFFAWLLSLAGTPTAIVAMVAMVLVVATFVIYHYNHKKEE